MWAIGQSISTRLSLVRKAAITSSDVKRAPTVRDIFTQVFVQILGTAIRPDFRDNPSVGYPFAFLTTGVQ
jgi:hypothetical protein